jgi:hypothetical protein
MKFKVWLRINEMLSGPGGGPESEPENQVALNRNIAMKGAGAFQTVNNRENPPTPAKTATAGYEDARFNRRPGKRFMKANQ